ncbi:hypothetical protein Vretimale_3551 [Volvox reticuliferus]|uniref:Uncharacterized protein n=1 Tax=Volvox reticuliferus TaxID=1737510 RepID=A0A8J4BXD5_9CHLO|nr:hypothetical protein Vretifemale_1180 [Volvox reticuliferus]GIL98135.1 hypothetical protein Vretimale_3551 [Volvox reticuliferus]
MIKGLALDLAAQAPGARARSTLAQYKEPWRDFIEWAALLQIQAQDIYDIRPEIVAMYLMYVFQSAKMEEVGPGRVSVASAAIACHFFLAGRASPTDHAACTLVRDLSKRTLRGQKLHRESMQPEHVRSLAEHFAGPAASLPDLMMVTAISVMFAGFLRFNDLAQVSVRHDLLVVSESHMAITLPKSKTDQEGVGHVVRIARVGGPACPVGLTERLLSLGKYNRVPRFPGEDVGPLLRRVKFTPRGHELQHVTGTARSPISSLSYTSFREKLQAMCSTAGINNSAVV